MSVPLEMRPFKVAIFNSALRVFEMLTDYLMSLDVEAEEWERVEHSINDVRDLAYGQKERLFRDLWPGLSYDQAVAMGEIIVGAGTDPKHVAVSETATAREFKEAILTVTTTLQQDLLVFFQKFVPKGSYWDSFDPDLDVLQHEAGNLSDSLLQELWPGKRWEEVFPNESYD